MSLFPLSTGRLALTRQGARCESVLTPLCDPTPSRAPWRALGPVGPHDTVEFWHARNADLRNLPAGASAFLIEDRVLARRRLRRLARRHGLVLERELVAIPSARAAVVLLDDRPEAVRRFWATVITVPPGISRGWLPATLLLTVARRAPWTWTGAAAPGRVVLARKP